MDEAALRAMMPMSFGKKQSFKKGAKVTTSSSSMMNDAQVTASGSKCFVSNVDASGATMLGKRSALDHVEERNGPMMVDDDDDDDDGLTAEERAANREFERRAKERRAQGLDSGDDDDDDDDDDDGDDDDDDIGPPPPTTQALPAAAAAAASSSSSSSAAPTMATSPVESKLHLPPMSSCSLIRGTHTKTLSALAVDASGSRFALGSYDYNLSLYDFGGMSYPNLSPFRLFEPCGSYPVLDLSFSSNGSHLLVISGTAEAKVFSRDGAEIATCKKGDAYLRDMRNTKGHVSSLTCGQWMSGQVWNNSNGSEFVTGGSDGTVRIWDVETMARGQKHMVVLKSKVRGGRTKVTALTTNGHVSTTSSLLAAGLDGSLTHWDLRSNLNSKPSGKVEDAHQVDTVTSSIAMGLDGYTVATRGGEGSVKLWDLRKFKTSLAERKGLDNASAHTSVIFDPFDARSLITCVSGVPIHAKNNITLGLGTDDKQNHSHNHNDQEADAVMVGNKVEGNGKIVVLDTQLNLCTMKEYAVQAGSPIRLHWNFSTDQLFCTTSTGTLNLFYTLGRSIKGITMVLCRSLDRKKSSSFYTSVDHDGDGLDSYPIFQGDIDDDVVNSNVLSESSKRRKFEKARQDLVLTRMPQRPVQGRGKGGRIGVGAMTGLVQSMFKTPQDLNQDPREALLRFAQTKQHTKSSLLPPNPDAVDAHDADDADAEQQ